MLVIRNSDKTREIGLHFNHRFLSKDKSFNIFPNWVGLDRSRHMIQT